MAFADVIDEAFTLIQQRERITEYALQVHFSLSLHQLGVLKNELLTNPKYSPYIKEDPSNRCLLWKKQRYDWRSKENCFLLLFLLVTFLVSWGLALRLDVNRRETFNWHWGTFAGLMALESLAYATFIRRQKATSERTFIGHIIVGCWVLLPPVFLWVDWVMFCATGCPNAAHTHDLARNIWVAFVVVLVALFNIKWKTS